MTTIAATPLPPTGGGNFRVTKGTHKHVVFGYGSLMSSESRKQQVTGTNWTFGTLLNFRRQFSATGLFNTARNFKHFVSPGTREDDFPLIPAFMPSYLNITYELGHELVGVYFPVTQKEYDDIVLREVNYSMIDITEHVADNIDLGGLRCYTAVAKTPALMRSFSAHAAVPSVYYETCLAAASENEEALKSWKSCESHKDFIPSSIIPVDLPEYLENY